MKVGYISGLNMDVWGILPNLVDYGKSHLCVITKLRTNKICIVFQRIWVQSLIFVTNEQMKIVCISKNLGTISNICYVYGKIDNL